MSVVKSLNWFASAILIATYSACFIEAIPFASLSAEVPVLNKQAEECTTEQHRPRFHFSPKRNWLNDPNGMVWYDGVYHLYFQYAPEQGGGGGKYWGHATSPDLAVWEEQSIAISPDDDLGEIWSGSGVVDSMNTTGFKQEDGPDPIIAIYTATGGRFGGQKQSIAYSLDKGYTFTKYENNPVLNSTETPDFRDPKVSWREGKWVMTLAVDDRIEFYSSPNLKDWRKDSEIGRNPRIGSHGGVWECPDLLAFDVEIDGVKRQLSVLVVSEGWGGPNLGTGTFYFIGNFTSDERGNVYFQQYSWHDTLWLDWGPDNYAGVTFSNEPQGRNIYMGWITNGGYAGATPFLTHRGHMTIPRQLGIRVLDQSASRYRLTSLPVPELEAFRNQDEYVEHQGSVGRGDIVSLKERGNFGNPLLELEINLEMKDNPEFQICANNDLNEEVCFGYESQGNRWALDRSRSGNVGFHPHMMNTNHSHAIREINDEKTNIRIFLDVSTIEVFADGGLTSMTALFFPTKPFDEVYIRNVRNFGNEKSTLVMEQAKVWGLKCWFNENVHA